MVLDSRTLVSQEHNKVWPQALTVTTMNLSCQGWVSQTRLVGVRSGYTETIQPLLSRTDNDHETKLHCGSGLGPQCTKNVFSTACRCPQARESEGSMLSNWTQSPADISRWLCWTHLLSHCLATITHHHSHCCCMLLYLVYTIICHYMQLYAIICDYMLLSAVVFVISIMSHYYY
jgi:hypothetical protein